MENNKKMRVTVIGFDIRPGYTDVLILRCFDKPGGNETDMLPIEAMTAGEDYYLNPVRVTPEPEDEFNTKNKNV